MKCPACTGEIADERSPSCPSCGAALEETYAPTRKLSDAPKSAPSAPSSGIHRTSPPSSPSRSYTSLDSVEQARFIAGTMLGERYRIVGLLGRGGMGEVYKAEDLRLGQMVALKLLPEQLSSDGAALARFHREVSVARQVSHRNVCRVYDIGEIEGLHFLSMEFVRGEELSSVIKRFGRLPSDKALEISRQLCAGLAAAHEAGILHRDLKPGNVMIDERGDVRIMDFGLAGLAEEFSAEHAVEGTPEYMSPEQFRGRELTARSDIYSLGLVLYEIFTGRKAFKADSLPALIRLRKSESLPENPSTIVRDLDPLVERTIERCLAPDPKDRPATALEVAAALPGGDPLAAALAAGETPSPEMVAAAPKQGSLRPAVALALLGGALALLAAALFLAGRVMTHNRVPLDKSAAVLRERAAEVAARLGYEQKADSASNFYYDDEYFGYFSRRDARPRRWDRLRTGRPTVIGFWYRQSPRPLVPINQRIVERGDPPRTVTGMAGVWLDTRGRLIHFYGVPPQITETAGPPQAEAYDWSRLLAEAGLEGASLQPAEPKWLPAVPFDEQAAWEGVFTEQPDVPLRVEAASFRGRPVHFQVVNPWDIPSREQQSVDTAGERVIRAVLVVVFVLILVGALLLARRNLRLGRGDRRGAFRLAVFVFVLLMATWPVVAHHVADLRGEFGMFIEMLSEALLISAMLWLVYVALEPFVRRRWPGRIISWNRLLAGDIRDPLVGRDVLLGAVFGFGLVLLGLVQNSLPAWLGWPAATPPSTALNGLAGPAQTLNMFVAQVVNSLVYAAGLLFLFLLFTIVFRREWPAFAVLLGLMTLLTGLSGLYPSIDVAFGLMGGAVTLFVLARFGLLALVATQFFVLSFFFYPITTDPSAWYAFNTLFVLALTLALVGLGFYASLAGQRLFAVSLDD